MRQAISPPVAVFAPLLTLLACANTPQTEVAAVMVDDDASGRSTLQAAVNEALGGASVLIAPDALTRDSVLIVEPVRLRDPQGLPAQGREMRLPERFRLLKLGAQCTLLHERTGQRLALNHVRCVAEAAK